MPRVHRRTRSIFGYLSLYVLKRNIVFGLQNSFVLLFGVVGKRGGVLGVDKRVDFLENLLAVVGEYETVAAEILARIEHELARGAAHRQESNDVLVEIRRIALLDVELNEPC